MPDQASSTPSPRKGRIRSTGFLAFLSAQALGAFNDNAFKTFVALLAIATMPADKSSQLIAIAGGLFIAPFILFSTLAGDMADRWSKKKLIVLFKVVEVVLLALSFFALYAGSIPALCALLFLMGTHSAFFGPVKLAIIPELVGDEDLSKGNGLMQMTTFLGIILGTVTATLLLGYVRGAPHLASLLFVAAAVAGLVSSLLLPDLPAVGSKEPLRFNVVARTYENFLELHKHYSIHLATVGAAYFWFVGAIFQMNLLVYGKELMGVSETAAGNFQIVVALGIGAGSYVAGVMSRGQVELGLVPVGALGLVVFGVDLAFAYRSTPRTLIDLALAGASAGAFVVPLQSFIQQRAPSAERGRIIATGNIISFFAILVASGCLWAFSEFFRLHPGQIFIVTSAMTLVVAAYIIKMLPDFFIRMLLYPFANLIYRLRVEGREHVPLTGAALLVSNHVSFIDAILIAMANQRMVRFLMFRTYYDLPVAHWFFKAMGCIPISDRDGAKAVIKSFQDARAALEQGDLVCIFAEGEISRHGQTQKFKKGFERIVKDLPVPVIPVFLDRVWGSIFSFEGGKALFKWPRRVPYPVTVGFGTPMPSSASAFEVRQAMLDLGSDAFKHRLAEKSPLALSFLQEAKRHWFRFAMADSTGAELSYGGALCRAWLLGRALDAALPAGDHVAVLLPPSVGGALANLGLSMRGRVPINLNYTASREIVLHCAERASCAKILTSRKFYEKLGWPEDPRLVYLEDVAAAISKPFAAAVSATFFLLPAFAVRGLALRAPAGNGPELERLATVIFTSGSTGVPKGVMLTHSNLLSNIEGLCQLYPVGKEDRILGILPFFHSFGFLGTLWFPLVTGFGVVYHYNPLEAKRIGDLVEKYKVSFLLATPTFLTAYLRRVEPEKFRSLRFVVAGAEKLRDEIGQAFEEKYGMPVLEGYGATELSPAAAVNIPDVDLSGIKQTGHKTGSIGQPLPGVLMKVVDPATEAALPAGTPGLLLVKGPNVMKGYLGDPQKTAEVMRDGFYVTGDIATISEDGFVQITDRLSRFSKIGGEMVPHIKIEEKLQDLAGAIEQTFIVTGVPDPKRGERLIVLYKGEPDIDGLLKKLQDSELPKLWLPDRGAFHQVQEFPLLGSGKLDIQKLKATAKDLEKVA
ncbi:MAG: MFS transporter [Elusimicrobia bacterium]|nr:MFS transporter [Elusimicrobiota bacterium]